MRGILAATVGLIFHCSSKFNNKVSTAYNNLFIRPLLAYAKMCVAAVTMVMVNSMNLSLPTLSVISLMVIMITEILAADGTSVLIQMANAQSTDNNSTTTNTTSTDTNGPSQSISIVSGSGNPDNDLFYDPSPAKVAVGSTVTWTNDDSLPHTVTSGNPEKGPSGMFDSGIMNAGKSFTYTFNKVEIIEYYCVIHPWMISTVTMQ